MLVYQRVTVGSSVLLNGPNPSSVVPRWPSRIQRRRRNVRSDYEAAKEQLERRRSSAEAQQKSHALHNDAEMMTPTMVGWFDGFWRFRNWF